MIQVINTLSKASNEISFKLWMGLTRKTIHKKLIIDDSVLWIKRKKREERNYNILLYDCWM
jgi:hypothetical protein